MFQTRNLGDVGLKIDPKTGVHFFNSKFKFKKVVIFWKKKLLSVRKCMT